jgi:hypothetical protein
MRRSGLDYRDKPQKRPGIDKPCVDFHLEVQRRLEGGWRMVDEKALRTEVHGDISRTVHGALMRKGDVNCFINWEGGTRETVIDLTRLLPREG